MMRAEMLAARNKYVHLLISPYAFAVLGFFLMVMSVLIPPSLYEAVVLEKDLMWMNFQMPEFYTSCIVIYVIGAIIASTLFYGVNDNDRKMYASFAKTKYNYNILIFGLCAAVALNLVSAFLLVKTNRGMLSSLLSLQGNMARDIMAGTDNSGTMLSAQTYLLDIFAWGFYRYHQMKDNIDPPSRTVIKRLLVATILLSIVISVLKVARYEIVPAILYVLILYLFVRSFVNRANVIKLALVTVGSGMLFVGVFMLFSFFRGADNSNLILVGLFGYVPASFNHLCMELKQNFMAFTGHGQYAFLFVNYIPIIHNFIDIGNYLGMVDNSLFMKSQYIMTTHVGLTQFIWITAFGYYYADLGNYVYLFLFVNGLIHGILWRLFLRGKLFGIVLYPFFTVSVALWFSYNYLVQAALMTHVVGACCLFILEWLCRYPARTPWTASAVGGERCTFAPQPVLHSPDASGSRPSAMPEHPSAATHTEGAGSGPSF